MLELQDIASGSYRSRNSERAVLGSEPWDIAARSYRRGNSEKAVLRSELQDIAAGSYIEHGPSATRLMFFSSGSNPTFHWAACAPARASLKGGTRKRVDEK